VSCPEAGDCTAVGDDSSGATVTAPLVESWHGAAWAVTPTPRVKGSASLFAVSCPTQDACVAVGNKRTGRSGTGAFAESWNGTAWSVSAAPSPAGSELLGVSCVSAASCVAVGGGTTRRGALETLIESWNGTRWSVTSSPSRSQAALSAVSCVSADFCTAVGNSGITASKTLIESWNGSRWSVVDSPNPSGTDDYLNGVSCTLPSACVAVGAYYARTPVIRTLVESWNGTGWSVMSTPEEGSATSSPATSSNVLNGVSCAGPTVCTAAGAINGQDTLAQTWGGGAWSVTPSPDPGNRSNFQAVACTAQDECTAVGSADNSGRVARPLIATEDAADPDSGSAPASTPASASPLLSGL
jgi:hypothetical protein